MSAALSLRARRLPIADPPVQRAILRQLSVPEFDEVLANHGLAAVRAEGTQVLQLNVGKMCNQTCVHCHVDAGPDRREVMSRETMELCLTALERSRITTVDLTGGAPEMNPNFRWLVTACRSLGRHVIDRCNLTILETPSHRDLPDFFAEHQVEVVASLPHPRASSTDRQRGDGVFDQSIAALRRLNQAGYGQGRPDLRLVLVTNPVGAFLPAPQAALERDWKLLLARDHGVTFDALYTITNMPISRYLEWLQQSGQVQGYMDRLVQAFNPAAAPGLMCRTTLSVGWDGSLYDCDFNQMLGMPIEGSSPPHIRDFDPASVATRPIRTDRHCFGCTAGAGSSCAGATTATAAEAR